jgi:hypothetical protein
MFVVGKQIKNNKIKRALQMIFFFFMFSYKSFCSLIVYEKKIIKKRHELYEINKKVNKKKKVIV